MEKQKPITTYALSAFLAIMLVMFSFSVQSAYAETIHYNVSGGSLGSISCSGAPNSSLIFMGENITPTSQLIGASVNRVVVALEWNGEADQTNAGTIIVGVWNRTASPTASNSLHVFGTILPEDITRDMLSYNFSSTDEYTFVGQDMIGIFYDSNNDQHCIRTLFANTDQFDGANTKFTTFDENDGFDFVNPDARDLHGAFVFLVGASGQTPDGVCSNVDVNGDGRVNVLDCVGDTNVWTGFTGGQNATDIASSIGDGLGITNCGTTNPDHETCGSGLFLFAFLLLLLESLSLGLYLGFTKKVNAEPHLVDVSLVMLMIGFVALAIGFYLDWIPDVVFYGIVVLIAGLLTFGIIKHVRG